MQRPNEFRMQLNNYFFSFALFTLNDFNRKPKTIQIYNCVDLRKIENIKNKYSIVCSIVLIREHSKYDAL